MKRLVSIALMLLLSLSVALAYTVKITGQGIDMIITSEEGSEVELQKVKQEVVDWKVNKGNVTITNNKFTMPKSDVEIEAVIQYQVSFNANGGSGTMAAQTFTYGTPQNLSANSFTRTGYTFSGWATSSGGNVAYANQGSYSAKDHATLYAKWTPITYSVKYNGNGSTSGTMSNSSHTYDVAKNLTANAFARAYTVTYNYNGSGASNTTATATWSFNGWNTAANGSGTSYTNQQSVTNLQSTTGTFNLYAMWTGGNVTLPTPTRTGYTFGGWYKEAACTTSAGAGGASFNATANTTLYAKWTAITYSVKYNGNGNTSGTMSNSSHTYDVAKNLTANAFARAYTVTYNYNGSGASNTTATATWSFAGWATSASGAKAYDDKASVTNLQSTTGTFNLYAKWTGGNVTLPTPTRTGYTFGGWYKEAACTTSAGAGGASFNATANTTLYAKWTAITYSVKYNGNGNTSGTMSNSSHTYDQAKNLTANAFKKEYTVTYNHNYTGSTNGSATAKYSFSGWATSASGSVAYADKASVTNLQSTTGTYNLYAKWGSNPTVTLPTPTRDGYKFEGWYSEAACTNLVGAGGASLTVTAARTLYAKWTLTRKIYSVTVIQPEGATVTGSYTNKICSSCGGTDHDCEVVIIHIEAEGANVTAQ